MPVYNEGANIGRALEEIYTNVTLPKRVLIVYDFDEDDTVPVARELMPKYPGVVLLKNTLGKGVLNAVRAGIGATTAEVVIVTMADLSDDLTVVSRMESMIREGGYDVVCASRYMKGGRQIGGPKFKGFLSRMAGLSLHWLAGLPTHDATNAFRAYRRSVLAETEIESRGGFEYSLELTAKAFARGRKIGEVPSTWRDRSAGESRFLMRKWLPQYLRWYNWTVDHSRRADRLALVTLLTLGLVVGLSYLHRRPDLAFTEKFVLGELGNELYRAERILGGSVLYRDLACQYGPIPVYLYAAVAGLAGNTAKVLLLWHLGMSLIALGLAYRLLRRSLGVGLALGVAVVACMPLMLAPGGVTGAITSAEYVPIERICLLLLMLLWRPADLRSIRRSASLGVLLGVWQGVKFGGALVAGSSLLLIDLLTLPPTDRAGGLRRAIGNWFAVAVGFVAVEAAWSAHAFATLPGWLARETIWPSYMVHAYRIFPERYPSWGGVALFIGQQWMPLLCAATGLAALIAWIARRIARPSGVSDEARTSAGAALGLVFLAIGAAVYLKQVWLIYQFLWVLAFPAAWGLGQVRPSRRLVLGALALPSLLLMAKTAFLSRPSPDVVPYRLPSGDRLHVGPKARRELDLIGETVAEGGSFGTLNVAFFNWAGGGFYHAYGQPFPLRNPMIADTALRPDDEATLIESLPRVRRIVVDSTDFLPGEDVPTALRRMLPPALARRVVDEYRIEPGRSAGRITILVRGPLVIGR